MKKVIVILGPTGVGKTKLSVTLAKKFNGEIISGDSIQVYKRLNIGSGKIRDEEKEGVKHHLIDVFDPHEECSVALFQKLAREKINEIQTPFLVGGTGLYIDAVIRDYSFDEKRDKTYENKYAHLSNDDLYQRLISLDPNVKMHMNNRKRVLRALEIIEKSNKSITENNKKHIYVYDVLVICLIAERSILYQKIDKRVDIMISSGLIEEARNLYNDKIYSQAIGYKELNEYFKGNISLGEAIHKIKINSHHYAKKQLTWFKNQDSFVQLAVDFANFNETVFKAMDLVSNFLGKK